MAAAIPLAWSGLVLEPSGDWPLITLITVTSVLFWTVVARGLVRVRHPASALTLALLVGALSPALCLVAMLLLVLPLWPLLALAGLGHLVFAPFGGAILLGFGWTEFAPIGMGMGIVAFAMTRAADDRS